VDTAARRSVNGQTGRPRRVHGPALETARACRYKVVPMAIPLAADTRLLFIGDSITDCGRRTCPEQIGSGYPRLVRDWLRAGSPATAPHVINTGISGNKVPDLQKRWDADVIAHAPDVVSVKIGINDVWHGLNPENPRGVDVETYTAGYRDILARLKQARPGVRIVLCEPSVIDPPQDARANEVLQPYVRAVRALAQEFAAECVVPLHAAFVDARRQRPDIAWTTDGVHPTSAGHMLIARTWLEATGLV
jgi:lysophospholipase L1-like esterase